MYEGIVQDLIDELGRLPGVGPKSAQRIAFHIVQTKNFDVSRLAQVLLEVRERVRFCAVCGNVSEGEECAVCRDPRRDRTIICVVEEPKDVAAIERAREFGGLYHVLGGAISPIDGIGPEDLNIRTLLQRLESGEVQEIIIATDPNLEGDATASYLSRLLSAMQVQVSRLASGLPVGGDLEYADEVTLGRAFAGRRQLARRDEQGVARAATPSPSDPYASTPKRPDEPRRGLIAPRIGNAPRSDEETPHDAARAASRSAPAGSTAPRTLGAVREPHAPGASAPASASAPRPRRASDPATPPREWAKPPGNAGTPETSGFAGDHDGWI